jgi:hypothetical protein
VQSCSTCPQPLLRGEISKSCLLHAPGTRARHADAIATRVLHSSSSSNKSICAQSQKACRQMQSTNASCA